VIFRIARESWFIWVWECVEGSLLIQKIGPWGASNAEMKACLLVEGRGRGVRDLVCLVGLFGADGAEKVVEIGTYEEEGFVVVDLRGRNGEESERIEWWIRSWW
jgi:hypothetical protein